MGRRAVEIIVVVAAAVVCLLAYLGKPGLLGWHHGFVFSPTVSTVVIILIAMSLIWILVRTIRNKPFERRLIFLYVGIAISLPLFMPLRQSISISENVRKVYRALEALPPGSKVLVTFDYDPSSAPELQPMAEAFLIECFRRDLKVIMLGLWATGQQQAEMAIDTAMARMGWDSTDVIYGEDYVNLGYQSGNEFVIQRLGSSFEAMFPDDIRGTPYREIPIVKNVRNYSNIDYSFNLSAGFVGTVEWVQVAVDRFGLKLGAGNTAVQAPTVYPYLRSGQLEGLLAGMTAAAEFEKLTGLEDKATTYISSLTFAHLIIIVFIIIGNVAFLRGGRKARTAGKAE